MHIFGMTNIGMKREVNQDSFLVREYDGGLLAVVCDGMGGASGGAEASSTAAAAFTGYTDIGFGEAVGDIDAEYIKDVLISAARAANNAVFSAASENDGLRGMGTTLVSAYALGGTVYAVNVGDSRMYIVENGKVRQITHDHSYVQYLVDIGKMTEDEARSSSNRNIITRAVGTEADVEIDFFTAEAAAGSFILLCTDGLTNHLTESEIAECVTAAGDPEAACAELIKRANLGGGSDNITAVIIAV